MSDSVEILMQRYLDQSISADELADLSARLEADAQLRRTFCEWLNLDSALAESAAGWASEEEEEIEREISFAELDPNGRRRLGLAWRNPWMAAAACVALLLVGGWWWFSQNDGAAVATVTTRIGGEVGEQELLAGTSLDGGRMALASGMVELITRKGARVVIEAPAEFWFETDQRMHLKRGRVAADVPPRAKGFTVVTPSGDAVDLGTRFGVDVPAAGDAEIHVFQGEVIAKASGDDGESSLREGDAVTLSRQGSQARELRSSAFIQSSEVSSLSDGLAAGQRERSAKALAVLREDPDLIALLDFEAEGFSHYGQFQMVQGRWPGSKAPEFVHEGDHLKLDVGGNHQWTELTLAAWVRLDRLGAPYQSLLHTDGWNRKNSGQVHWMVTREATMRLAMIGNNLKPGTDDLAGFTDSRTSVLPEQGRWVHLATVFDASQRKVRFYLNGQFDAEVIQTNSHPARLGRAQIGNWNAKDRKLSGRVDEMLLLGRAMSDEEIAELFAAGNPYR